MFDPHSDPALAHTADKLNALYREAALARQLRGRRVISLRLGAWQLTLSPLSQPS